ncbi:HepT-like ribonuclease domain-containing protein [Trichothermofontia sp.]
MPSRSAKEHIQDILNAIDSIQRRTTGMSFDQLSQDETIVKAVLYDLIVIGEASINIPADVQALWLTNIFK